MLISHTTEPSPEVSVNEDVVVSGPHFVAVLDGATEIEGVDTGCVHDVRWLVERLAGQLARLLLTERSALTDILARGIEAVMAEHADTCDLGNPDSPATTVSIVAERGDTVDYLVLADSPVVLRDRAGGVDVVLDDRVAHLPGDTLDVVRQHRNVPGGFWVASNTPAAAAEALTETIDRSTLDCVGVFSDGASRLVERHGMDWSGLLELLDADGPAAVIQRVRHEDNLAAGRMPGKAHDDATAARCRFP